jgi:hypothetical protein
VIRRFGRTYHLCLQGRKSAERETRLQQVVRLTLVSEAGGGTFLRMSAHIRTTRRDIPEDGNIRIYRCENLISYIRRLSARAEISLVIRQFLQETPWDILIKYPTNTFIFHRSVSKTPLNVCVCNICVGLSFFPPFFLGGWVEPNALLLRPLLAYCTCPGWWWMMMSVEQSVEWLAGETEVFGENVPQGRFVHHKSHMT